MPDTEPGSWISPHPRGSVLSVTVVPRSSKTALEIGTDGAIRLRVAAPPVDGAANAAALRFLAETLGISRSRLEISSGATGRRKRFLVADIAPRELEDRLRRALTDGR